MIYACEHHDAVLSLWRRQELRGIALAHVDFHDDLRGLLVDRRRKLAYAIGSLAGGAAPVDAGNFLAHAVLEGRVRQVAWVHDAVGGRAWDMGIVRFESDLFAMHHRLRHAVSRNEEIPFDFSEGLLDDWVGPGPEQRLSVDWDCFASILQDAGGIDDRVGRFLERLGDSKPADTYVSYSPEYCHPTLDAFKGFVDRLSDRLGQTVEWLDPDLRNGSLNPTGVRADLPSNPLDRAVLYLRRRGIY